MMKEMKLKKDLNTSPNKLGQVMVEEKDLNAKSAKKTLRSQRENSKIFAALCADFASSAVKILEIPYKPGQVAVKKYN